jgi:Zn finger protein HypA/HybF involved in hydrogenase expression
VNFRLEGAEKMSQKKKDGFICVGCVHPREYNWKKQMLDTKKLFEREHEPFIPMDVGKILGLAQYACDLEDENARQKKEINQLRSLLCPTCGGDGVVDSGGQDMNGNWINILCPECRGSGIPKRRMRNG